jgi:hypothetical protein
VTIKRVYTSRNLTMFYKGSLRDFAEVAMSPKILAICLQVATEEALPAAIRLSPRDEGDYVRSWQVRPNQVVLRGMRRFGARLINTAPHSALVEFGGRKRGGSFKGRYRPAQHILLKVRDRITGADGLPDADLAGGP